MDRAELAKLPYLQVIPQDDRIVPLATFYDVETSRFSAYVQSNGKLLVLQPGKMHRGIYVAKGVAEPQDAYLKLVDLLFQSFSFSKILSWLSYVQQDLVNSIASIHKYFVLLGYTKRTNDPASSDMVIAEIEYALANHRSFYDCLNKIVQAWRDQFMPKSNNFPESFAKVVENNDEASLSQKYNLPKPLIDFYLKQRDAFLATRDLRNKIIHSGHTVQIVFVLDDGFAISTMESLLSELIAFNIWSGHQLKNNRLGSILGLLCFLTQDMLTAMNSLAEAFIQSTPALPEKVAPDFQVYFRSPLCKHLEALEGYKNTHWFNPEEILSKTS